MDYGARVCGIRPKCGECVVSRWCASPREQPSANGALPSMPLLRIADERGSYDAKPPVRRKQPKFEGSARWWRGRIVAALRSLPPGESITLAKLRATLSREGDPPPPDELTTLVSALESHGLVKLRGKRIALPE
jgi:A/G-specific adenine glycosylase